ncbi:MAG TPA: DNA repair protein RecN [Candidatus Avacidaminococcus intestinavium]|uniref:DNA repair protein RecN n=1 Tax=Candidatus Avacidaminococcus intestinavium TaxID=2840684 RepID=A0A9D1MPF0_9FIRM|nr:DNA repair protein RecN [Candidatus Avacidaminococcus intestinavium]
MLKSLHIHNFALIEDLNIEFKDGFNVFTGETGAGKSIFIDAMGIVLGGRASLDYLPTAAESYWLQAIFDVEKNIEALKLLEDYDLEPEDGCIFIRRKVLRSGKSTALINGCQIPVSFLQKLGETLLDIHGQHENQRLLKASEPLMLLSVFGNEKLESLFLNYNASYKEYIELKNRIQELEEKNSERERILDRLKWEINEIEVARLVPGEEDELEEKVKKLTNLNKIMNAVASSYELFMGLEEGTSGILDSASLVQKKLTSAADFDVKLAELAEHMGSIWIMLDEVRHELKAYLEENTFEPELLEEYQERLDLIYRLKKKYGSSIKEVMAYYNGAIEEAEELSLLEMKIAETQKLLDKKTVELWQLAEEISVVRTELAKEFAVKITDNLRELAMPESLFLVKMRRKTQLSATGIDEAVFYFTANRGQGAKQLAKIASGGELSRIALAIKSVLSNRSGVHTMVFDEIDTGVGGVTARKMAEKIARIANFKQVLCVTHLAQIAVFADAHFCIEKQTEKKRTLTKIRPLESAEKVHEIVRMTGGSNDNFAAAEQYALELLKEAQRSKSVFSEKARSFV